MTLRRRIAVGGVLVVSGAALAMSLLGRPVTAEEWDWIGLEEDLDLLETLPVDGADGWCERSADLVEELAAVDVLPRAELERHLSSVGRLLAVAGAAAERCAPRAWPRHGVVGGRVINVSWYRAAKLVRAHPELAPLTADRSAEAAIEGLVRGMASGDLPVTDQLAPVP